MKQSEQIGELAAALAKAQAALQGVARDSNNPFFKSKYASLDACWDAIRETLSKNGLAVIQGHDLNVDVQDGVVLSTKLMHSSGQWIESTMPLILSKKDMQGLGGATTYAKRYALCAMVGLAEHDDDGNSVSPQAPKPYQAPAQNQTPAASAPSRAPVQKSLPLNQPKPATAPQNKFQGGWQARKELHNVRGPTPAEDDIPPFGDDDFRVK